MVAARQGPVETWQLRGVATSLAHHPPRCRRNRLTHTVPCLLLYPRVVLTVSLAHSSG